MIVLLTWFYISGFIFLMGGEINAIIEDARPKAKPAARARRARRRRPRANVRARFRPGAADSAAAAARSKGGIPPEAAGGTSMKRGKLPRWLRRLLITSAIVVGVVVAIRLLLDPVATHFTRKALNDADGIRGDFHSVHVTVFPPGYEIHPHQARRASRRRLENPLFYAERVDVRASTERAVARPGGGARAAG